MTMLCSKSPHGYPMLTTVDWVQICSDAQLSFMVVPNRLELSPSRPESTFHSELGGASTDPAWLVQSMARRSLRSKTSQTSNDTKFLREWTAMACINGPLFLATSITSTSISTQSTVQHDSGEPGVFCPAQSKYWATVQGPVKVLSNCAGSGSRCKQQRTVPNTEVLSATRAANGRKKTRCNWWVWVNQLISTLVGGFNPSEKC